MIETLESRVPPYDRSRSSYLLSDRDPYPYAFLRMVPGPDAETVTGPAAAVASSLVDTAPLPFYRQQQIHILTLVIEIHT